MLIIIVFADKVTLNLPFAQVEEMENFQRQQDQ